MASFIYTVTKIARVGECLVGASGRGDKIREFQQWIRDGKPVEKFPKRDEDATFFTGLVVHRDGRIERYEGSPNPILVEDRVHGIGSGSEIARAAMYLGCDAARAVEVACMFDGNCGNGIDTLTFEDPT